MKNRGVVAGGSHPLRGGGGRAATFGLDLEWFAATPDAPKGWRTATPKFGVARPLFSFSLFFLLFFFF
jgi:hypothetical protein